MPDNRGFSPPLDAAVTFVLRSRCTLAYLMDNCCFSSKKMCTICSDRDCIYTSSVRNTCVPIPLFGFIFMASSSQRKYQYKLHDALQVNEDTQGWTVIVQVLIKYPTKPSVNKPDCFYKKFLFTDMKGTVVSAITFNAIDHFDRVFEPFKRYYITCSAVRVADPRFKVGDYNYTWTLYPRTHVQVIDDPKPYVSPYSFDYTKFSEMYRMADRNVSIAVRGLIVHSIPVPTVKNPFVRDYVLIDEEKRPMILRVWADVLKENETEVTKKLPEPTFIAAVDLKVTTYNGLSLTTGFEAHFMVSPPLREAEPLLAWYNEHATEVKFMIREEAYKATAVLLTPPPMTDIVPINEAARSMATLKTAWVKGTVHLDPAQSKLWHTVCDKCKKTVCLPVGSDLPCTYCNKVMNVEPRCYVHVYLHDRSGTILATIFSSVAEKFIGYSAMELFEAAEKGTPLNDTIAAKIEKKEVMCFLKDHDKSYSGKFERTFPIVAIYMQEDDSSMNAQPSSELVADTIESMSQVSASSSNANEKQMFSPNIRGVVDQMATKVGLNDESSLTAGLVKRGMSFDEIATTEEDNVTADKIPSPDHEKGKTTSTSESPVKRLKNVVGHN